MFGAPASGASAAAFGAADWLALEQWAVALGAPRQWGIEGAGQYGRGLAQRLVADGESVVEVNPRQTAAMRRAGRVAGKTDRLDAQAVARVVRSVSSGIVVVQAAATQSMARGMRPGHQLPLHLNSPRIRHPVAHRPAGAPARHWDRALGSTLETHAEQGQGRFCGSRMKSGNGEKTNPWQPVKPEIRPMRDRRDPTLE